MWLSAYSCRRSWDLIGRLVRLTGSNRWRRSLSNTSSPSHHPPRSSPNTNSDCQTRMRLQSVSTHISTHSHWLWQCDWSHSLFILSLCQGWPVTRTGRRGCTGCRWTTSHVSQSQIHSHPAGRIVYWTGVTAGRGSESIHWTEQTVSALLSIQTWP